MEYWGLHLGYRGRNRSWSPASADFRGRSLECAPRVVFLQARAPSSHGPLSVRARLGPGTYCCRACNCTDIASSNKILRNPKGLKVTASLLQLGQIMKNKIQKENHNYQL